MKVLEFFAKLLGQIFLTIVVVVGVLLFWPSSRPASVSHDIGTRIGVHRYQPLWKIRSTEFCFGIPMPTDARYDFVPEGGSKKTCGISVLAKEGFWIGHCDRFRVPLWVCSSWTREDLEKSLTAESPARNFRVDKELPSYAQATPDYNHSVTSLDRSHMSSHADNKAWGKDNADEGCEMSNIAPQKSSLNRGIWKKLEEVHREMSLPELADADRIWIIAGCLFDHMKPQKILDNHVGVPGAFYKIIAWLSEDGTFYAHGFIFPQEASGSSLSAYLVPIDEIETRAGLDFFWELDDFMENVVEVLTRPQEWNSI